jgi:hypothetical protein
LQALKSAWGEDRFLVWLAGSSCQQALLEISNEDMGPPGFPSLANRIMEPTRTNTVVQFLRELSQNVGAPTTITIGGSVSLILVGMLTRKTDDIDVVDEVPVHIRSQHDLLESLAKRYGLRLTHFQSHYLPRGWDTRAHIFMTFRTLEVRLVDPCDIFLSKLFSPREKDRDDLRELARCLDKQSVADGLIKTAAALAKEEKLRQNAERNWFVVYGESLPR